MINVDVVILGGGPVGCLLGVLLNDMGVSNMIVERDVVPYQLPRAIVMDDEIQRLFVDHGMGEWLQNFTSPMKRADFVGVNDEVFIGADIPPLGLQGLPPVVAHYQPQLDTMLRAEVEKRGSHGRWGRTVSSMTDLGEQVLTVLDNGENVTSRWFIGADGASSWTRKQVGLLLEDLRFDQQWLVVDVELHDDSTASLPVGARQYCVPERPTTYVQGHAKYRRWEFQIQLEEDAEQLNTHEGLWELLSPWLTPRDADLIRSAVYRFHAVVAPDMRKGNVFLAGDSAHQTPPFAGQGLNSGMRDAINLAWKMSLVVRGLATEKILDTYSQERVPHVKSAVAHAVDMGRLIDQLAGRVSHGVDVESGYGGSRPQPHIESGMVVGNDPRVGHQFWYHQAVSEAVRKNLASFAVVSRTPIEMSDAWVQLSAVNVVAPEAVGEDFAIVVRPDRFVAGVAKTANELEQIATTLSAYVR